MNGNYPELQFDIRGARDLHQGQQLSPDLLGIDVIDDATLIAELEQPVYAFLQKLTSA